MAPFKDVVNDVIPIDLNRDEHDIDAYLSALKNQQKKHSGKMYFLRLHFTKKPSLVLEA